MTMMTSEEIAAPNKIDKTTTDIVFISIPEIQVPVKLLLTIFCTEQLFLSCGIITDHRALNTDGQLLENVSISFLSLLFSCKREHILVPCIALSISIALLKA